MREGSVYCTMLVPALCSVYTYFLLSAFFLLTERMPCSSHGPVIYPFLFPSLFGFYASRAATSRGRSAAHTRKFGSHISSSLLSTTSFPVRPFVCLVVERACRPVCVYCHSPVLSMPTPFCRLLRSAAGPASCGGSAPLRRLHLATTSSSLLLASSSSSLTFSPSSVSLSLSLSSSSCTPLSSFVFLPCRSYTTRKKKKNMPPKKAPVQEKVLLGRPGNNLKSGIVCELCPHRLVFFLKTLPTSPFLPSFSFLFFFFFFSSFLLSYKYCFSNFFLFVFFFSFSSLGINHAVIIGWFGQCWQVDTLPGYYQVVAG